MAERRVTIQVDLDLTRGSRQTHKATLPKLSEEVGQFALERFEECGFTVRACEQTSTVHYVRNVFKKTFRKPKKLRVVKDNKAS